jgi:hypothetical protein
MSDKSFRMVLFVARPDNVLDKSFRKGWTRILRPGRVQFFTIFWIGDAQNVKLQKFLKQFDMSQGSSLYRFCDELITHSEWLIL